MCWRKTFTGSRLSVRQLAGNEKVTEGEQKASEWQANGRGCADLEHESNNLLTVEGAIAIHIPLSKQLLRMVQCRVLHSYPLVCAPHATLLFTASMLRLHFIRQLGRSRLNVEECSSHGPEPVLTGSEQGKLLPCSKMDHYTLAWVYNGKVRQTRVQVIAVQNNVASVYCIASERLGAESREVAAGHLRHRGSISQSKNGSPSAVHL